MLFSCDVQTEAFLSFTSKGRCLGRGAQGRCNFMMNLNAAFFFASLWLAPSSIPAKLLMNYSMLFSSNILTATVKVMVMGAGRGNRSLNSSYFCSRWRQQGTGLALSAAYKG